jgi:hypothetical protein
MMVFGYVNLSQRTGVVGREVIDDVHENTVDLQRSEV